MTDIDAQHRMRELVEVAHQLRERGQQDELWPGGQTQRLQELKTRLDQCWDRGGNIAPRVSSTRIHAWHRPGLRGKSNNTVSNRRRHGAVKKPSRSRHEGGAA